MAKQIKTDSFSFTVGDTIAVYQRIEEGLTKEGRPKIRTQIFEGIVIAIKGKGENRSFTVRKIATGAIGVERIWPVNSPWIEKIKVKKAGHVRRAKLYYLRQRVGKRAVKVKSKKTNESKKPARRSAKN